MGSGVCTGRRVGPPGLDNFGSYDRHGECLDIPVAGRDRCPFHAYPRHVYDAFAALSRTCARGPECKLEFTTIDFSFHGVPMLHNESGEGEEIAYCPKCGGRLKALDG